MSKLATVGVGDPGNLPDGTKIEFKTLKLKISGVQPTNFEKTLTFTNQGSGAFEDPATKLPYGTYRFLLSYLDVQDKVVVESCSPGTDKFGKPIPDEKSRVHKVESARYSPNVMICFPGKDVAVPGLPPSTNKPTEPDSADVVIRPTIPDTSKPSTSGSASAVFDKNARFYVDPYSLAANDAANMKNANDPNFPLVDYIAKQGSAVWLGSWSGNVGDAVRTVVDKAQQQDAYPVFVAYMIPYRDCGLHSAGGLDAAKYIPWINDIANAVGTRKAIVILEPDAVPGMVQVEGGKPCLSTELRAERANLMKTAIGVLKSKPNLKVFVDAGHSAWLSADVVSGLLKEVGIDKADGFSLNTSNYQSTAAQISYGQSIRSQVGNKSFLIDTSRNGIDPAGNTEWCNPRNRALGKLPTFDTGVDGVAAFIWGKRPGESDGACNGGPAAGNWWREIAIELAKNAGVK
ncbi:MAG TPA: glycoside hydrolase family 6 protein [Oligoflexus sp.]|uniref:glycoside hydrolase family 6 protein n=1 Tax=Oligoflexus sp. TaxID=1971216 RepID=UPI002D7FA7E9|nr:glycoside hydrolase family 6 protein [Oligoflexus sp.]HET9239915.1 glycoside hydrolase family 6 protein [Oligoflexus sp.]